jgi:hypothetical protein
MRVGGGGGIDSQLAMFRVSPGESIHVRTQQQQEAARVAASGGGGRQTAAATTRVTNQIVVRSDPREVTRAMGSRSGQTEHVALKRKFDRRR